MTTEKTKLQISEGTVIVELQQEVGFLRNRVLVLSEMLMRADGEIGRLTAGLTELGELVNATAADAVMPEEPE